MRQRLPGKKLLKIELEATTDGQRTATIAIEPTWKIITVIEEICRIPDLRIKQANVFGLAQKHDTELFFLRKDEKICCYAPKGWVSGKRTIRGSNEFVLYLKTQYFVGQPAVQLIDLGSRYYYYLGIKSSVAKSKVMVPVEMLLELVALGLQAEYGDQNPTFQAPGTAYFRLNQFVPAWLLKEKTIMESGGERFLRKCIGNLHRELAGLTPYKAQLKFIEKAGEIEDVIGHFHILYKDSKGKKPTALMVVCQTGIRIHKISEKYDSAETFPRLQFEYSWTGISSFQIENKKLILRPENQPSCRKM